MAATVLAQQLLDSGVGFLTIHIPTQPDGPWRANVRRDAGWAVGDYKPTLEEAVADALEQFRPWTDPWREQLREARRVSATAAPVVSPAVMEAIQRLDDDLEDLFG